MRIKFCDAIILAAGSSKRFDSSQFKQYFKINNKSLIDLAIYNLNYPKKLRTIYVVLNKESNYKIPKNIRNVETLIGGNTRTKSVYKALSYLSKDKDSPYNVLIHDAARPCLDIKELKELIEKGNSISTGLSLGYPLTNALKRVGSGLNVIENIKRNHLYMSFTPQLYNFAKLFKAYTDIINKKLNVDDEIEAMTKLGYKVKIIKSSPRNIKLTYQDDVKVIKDLMKKI